MFIFNTFNSNNFLKQFINFINRNINFINRSSNFYNLYRFYGNPSKRCKNNNFPDESLESDYNKYFKPKKDLMRFFPQGYIKVVKLKGISYNNYKIKH